MSKEVDFRELRPKLTAGLIFNCPRFEEVAGLLAYLKNCCKCRRNQTIIQIKGYISGWPTSLSPEKKDQLRLVFETDLLIINHDHGSHTEKICEF